MSPVALAALDGIPEDGEEEEETGGGITNVTHKEAFMSVETVEKIAAKLSCPINLGNNKAAPISLSDAADAIMNSPKFKVKVWLEKRNKLFNFTASSAGSKLPPSAVVSSVLTGYLGKHANML